LPEYDSTGTVAFFRERHRAEAAATARVLTALPADGLAYAPHPGSSTAGTTAWTIVRGLRASLGLLRSSSVVVGLDSHPDYRALMTDFEETSNAVAESLVNISQRDWSEKRTVTSEGVTILRQPLGQILWLFHVDGIHHRGQLSTYLRPMGAVVPSIYGPSGDQPRLPL
jgi:uncharacterized damage-inducible protein DinB